MVDQAAALKRFSRIGVLALALICGIALAGLVLGIPVLASIVPGWPRMALIVVLCFLLCGAAVLELTRPATGGYPDLARIAAAGIVLAVGGATLLDFVPAGGLRGASAGTTNLFGPTLGRPSPASAFNFLVAAAALMVPRGDRRGLLYSALVATGLVVTGFDFVGYAYGIAALSRGPTISTMSLPTMLSFVLLFVAMFLARPRAGWTAVIFGKNSAGIIARRFLPTVLILPFVVNGILVLAYRSRPFEALFGFAILAVVTSAGLAIVTVVIATWLARHEEEQQRSQDLLEAIAEGSMAVIYVKDLAGRYLLVNRRYLDIFGMNREAVIGKTDYDIFPKDEAAAFRAMDEQVIAVDHSLIEEEIVALPDGLHTYVSAKAPLRNAAGKPYAIFGISTDITDRKRGEEALAASEERTSLIVETALDAVIGIDRHGAITGWNRQAESIFGWTHKEALGR
ncbi:MAG: PAS domain S-box protein, partial [Mesorhizobium sp.]